MLLLQTVLVALQGGQRARRKVISAERRHALLPLRLLRPHSAQVLQQQALLQQHIAAVGSAGPQRHEHGRSVLARHPWAAERPRPELRDQKFMSNPIPPSNRARRSRVMKDGASPLLAVVSVGLLWGCTNPLVKRGAARAEKKREEAGGSFWWSLLTTPSFLIPQARAIDLHLVAIVF